MPKITEVKITLSGDGSGKSGSRKKRVSRGPHIGVRGDEILSRRKNKQGIRLFDLGQRKSGDLWTSIDVVIAPPLLGASGVTPPSIRSLQLSDFESVDAIFISEAGNWKEMFRPIAKGGPLETNSKISVSGMAFGDFLPNLPTNIWNSSGLHVTTGDLTAGLEIDNANGYIEPVILLDNGTYKITAANSFASPTVAFTPTTQMDVFLVPAIVTPSVADGYIDSFGAGFAEQGGFFYTTIYRPSLFNVSDPNYSAFNLPFPGNWPTYYYTLLYLKSQASTKAARLDFGPDTWSEVAISTFPGVGLFPSPPTNPPTGGSAGLPRYDLVAGIGAHNGGFGTNNASGYPGALVAVVQKGNDKFYFWAQ